jgi:hypothetical protein
MPRKTSTTARQSACRRRRDRGWPAAVREPAEKARATPTRKEKDGWMRSCSDAPTHGTWLW